MRSSTSPCQPMRRARAGYGGGGACNSARLTWPPGFGSVATSPEPDGGRSDTTVSLGAATDSSANTGSSCNGNGRGCGCDWLAGRVGAEGIGGGGGGATAGGVGTISTWIAAGTTRCG